MKEYEPYQGTTVPVSRSQEQIRKLLIESGAQAHQFSEYGAQEMIEISWARVVKVNNEPKLQPLRIKVSYKGKKIEQVWRALFYHLKAKLEIVKFGIMSFEEEFLSYFVVRLPDGSRGTIAEALVPSLKRAETPDLGMAALPPAREEDK